MCGVSESGVASPVGAVGPAFAEQGGDLVAQALVVIGELAVGLEQGVVALLPALGAAALSTRRGWWGCWAGVAESFDFGPGARVAVEPGAGDPGGLGDRGEGDMSHPATCAPRPPRNDPHQTTSTAEPTARSTTQNLTIRSPH